MRDVKNLAERTDHTKSKKRILVVDDEPHIVEVLKMNLELEGYEVHSASSGFEALEKISKQSLDMVTLDVMLPRMNGFETLGKIREVSAVPVVMLSVLDKEEDKIKGIELGADDYVAKPFRPEELIARIKAVMRRVQPPIVSREKIQVDDNLLIDFSHRKVVVRDKEFQLRPTECRLLYQLVNNAGCYLSHDSLLKTIWGIEYRDEQQYVWQYITYLRNMIEENPMDPIYIQGEQGLGYRFIKFEKPPTKGKKNGWRVLQGLKNNDSK